MIGSPLVGAWVAQAAFWFLSSLGIVRRALDAAWAAIFAVFWLTGYIGLPRIAWWAGPLVVFYVATLEIALVFVVSKRDVRLS
jgi:hypothetical protein